MRTGIFGGSFNPVHKGHIHLARAVMDELSLDRIIFVPSKVSPHRSSAEYVSGEDRMEMLRLSFGNDSRFQASGYELGEDRVSYTIYTIEHFRSLYPDDELFLLVGSDMLMCFDKWYRFRDILSQAALAVVSRKNGDMTELLEKAEELSEYGRIIVCKAPAVELSSTEIRKKIAKNENLTCYLDENVVQYIRYRDLYSK
ncbi:MAG: nicotinate (nicotinamide) nucleotide adenylyltransferase [Ruminococcus sp.]|nr:nicotinate (nicotinamide) nucleotide adenylyltransferase [Oscillospiraceae bacterium]